MKEVFNKAMELSGVITKSKNLIENERVRNKFFADRYFELVKYGIVQKEWDSE